MSHDDFDQMFGRQPRVQPSFVERVARNEAFGGRVDVSDTIPDGLAADTPLAGEYRAFGMLPSSQVHASCELRWWMDGTTIPEGLSFPYRLLMEVGFSGDDTLRLLLPDKAVEIVGDRLEPLRQGLMRQRVSFIQQISPLVWRSNSSGDANIRHINIAR